MENNLHFLQNSVRMNGNKLLKIFVVIFFATMQTFGAYSQDINAKIRLSVKDASLKSVFETMRKQSKLEFIYSDDEIKNLKVTATFSDLPFKDAMDQVLKNLPLSYQIKENRLVVILTKKELAVANKKIVINGRVLNRSKEPIEGATIIILGSTRGAISDGKGTFMLDATPGDVLEIAYVGYEAKKHVVRESVKDLVITLEEDALAVDDVIVTGIYKRNKESFTGSAATYTGAELKSIGTQNILQSLKTMDPSFVILENNQQGSNPNVLPDMEIRGKSSIVGFKEAFASDPNQPLFILDGFETTLQVIMDLQIDRVASLTILKDAASTAIYGSKAANGVIVIETKAPQKGKLRVSYSGSLDVSMADLSDYNLMNAPEKLEFERQSGRFSKEDPIENAIFQARYNHLKQEVDRGVDTYWMSEPLRTGINHRHNLYIEGGDERMRYGLGAGYTNTEGVMKNSVRNVFSGNFDLIYRVKSISFSNKFSLEHTGTDDPVVNFSEYSRANPYYRKRDASGNASRMLEESPNDTVAGTNLGEKGDSYKVYNPLWNDALNSFRNGEGISFRNNFDLEWRILPELRALGSFGISHGRTTSEDFYAPEDTQFDKKIALERGSYTNRINNSTSYNGRVSVTYGKVFGDGHQVNAVIGGDLQSSTSTNKSYSAVGFPIGEYTKPSFANSYTPDAKPSYRESVNRSVSAYFNAGYSFKNRYLLDFNLRSDGSSVFGSNRRFTTTWAAGLGWNVHQEPFMKNLSHVFNVLKVRSSIGNPGNQNFGGAKINTVYEFDNWMLNDFGAGLLVSGFGNPDFDWQKTLDFNFGTDISMLDNRFHITFDVYNKTTNPLAIFLKTPSSIGTLTMTTNVGKQVDKGISGTVKYSALYNPAKRINYTISLNFRRNKGTYNEIGTALDQINKNNQESKVKTSSSLLRYFDGGSTTSLWAVKSKGIDPASGEEMLIKKDGTMTFTYDTADQIEIGDTRPTIEGVFGHTFMYKGFSLNLFFRYSFGADLFNSALYDKVENISDAALANNQDKRALYERWHKPGDIAKFKSIAMTSNVPITSRFVEEDNYFSLESAKIGYTFMADQLRGIGLESLSLSAYVNEIFRVSSIKRERGIDYPFARSVSFALSFTF